MTLPQGWDAQAVGGDAPPHLGTHERMQHAIARECRVNVLDVILTEENATDDMHTLITATISTNQPQTVRSRVETTNFAENASGEAGVAVMRASVFTTELCGNTNCTIDSETERMVIHHSRLESNKQHMCGEPTWIYGSAQSDSIQCVCECIDKTAIFVEPTSNLNDKFSVNFKAFAQSANVTTTQQKYKQHAMHVGKTDNENTKYPTPAP
jgi:hypothetical protein